MAKKRKRTPAIAASTTTAAPTGDHATTTAPPRARRRTTRHDDRAPAFWFGFEVAWAKLAIGRVLIFSLLALDAVLAIRHAPRYGAGGFNVAQLAGLDALGPTRASYEIAQLVNAYLFVLVACGVATRIALPLATAIYAWLYFGSQLDSYQHHYLVALVLLIACFVPWRRHGDAAAAHPVPAWALRLLLVQLGIMYLWAAISKLNHAWLDGALLTSQITGGVGALIAHTVGMHVAAIGVIVVELALAVMVWNPRAWPIAAPLGLAFHLGIVFTGLEIGLFAWLMIGLYAFVIPDRVWLWLADAAPGRALRRGAHVTMTRVAGAGVWIMWLIAIVLGLVVASLCRFEHTLGLAVIATIVPVTAAVGAFIGRGRARMLAWIAVAHLLALSLWLAVDRASTVAVDYYRFWGGSSLRLGANDSAERAYRGLIKLAPNESVGHFGLARALLATGDGDGALVELHATEELEPRRARAWLEEARWQSRQHRDAAALAAARDAIAAEPDNADARSLLAQLTGAAPPTPPTKPTTAPAHARDDDSEPAP